METITNWVAGNSTAQMVVGFASAHNALLLQVAAIWCGVTLMYLVMTRTIKRRRARKDA